MPDAIDALLGGAFASPAPKKEREAEAEPFADLLGGTETAQEPTTDPADDPYTDLFGGPADDPEDDPGDGLTDLFGGPEAAQDGDDLDGRGEAPEDPLADFLDEPGDLDEEGEGAGEIDPYQVRLDAALEPIEDEAAVIHEDSPAGALRAAVKGLAGVMLGTLEGDDGSTDWRREYIDALATLHSAAPYLATAPVTRDEIRAVARSANLRASIEESPERVALNLMTYEQTPETFERRTRALFGFMRDAAGGKGYILPAGDPQPGHARRREWRKEYHLAAWAAVETAQDPLGERDEIGPRFTRPAAIEDADSPETELNETQTATATASTAARRNGGYER